MIGARRAATAFVLVVAAMGAGGACTRDDAAATITLDGSARVPDDEGIVTDISTSEIELDGKRRYGVADGFRSFSTYTLELEPMLSRRGQYVQVGVDDGDAVWMAGIAAVVEGSRPTVYYTGEVRRRDGERLVMRDGSVFAMSDEVADAYRELRGAVTIEIDAAAHEIVRIVAER